MTRVVAGTAVVLSDEFKVTAMNFLGLEPDTIYRVQEVIPVPAEKVLPDSYIKMGVIPDSYKRHLSRGVRTTYQDLVGSDEWWKINGKEYSAAHFRAATKSEIERAAKDRL